ncbi:hypothetical protein [Fuerstiella marisgermanici]|uniref:Uncharacterized protein n=1 Tax=Fuerstiella marisgermanici TaxID=1891926 RepID=A0A1P8WFV8_9PLAN|nr:hypothetical protein [Fuerstiella marisgermanici]APZ92946.1 hypothetical protein Fuma_02558 [Fuerstiella marisgermanici]
MQVTALETPIVEVPHVARIDNRRMLVPTAPGLGIEIAPQQVVRYRVECWCTITFSRSQIPFHSGTIVAAGTGHHNAEPRNGQLTGDDGSNHVGESLMNDNEVKR